MQKKGFRQFERCFALFFLPQSPFSKNTLGLSFLLSFLFLLSSFQHSKLFFSINPFLRQYSCFVSLALSLLPLPFLCFRFFLSNQFPAIPFSNPPCFHFWSFRSSIFPLCMTLFSGLAFPSFFFLLVFVWFSSDCCCHLFSSSGIYCLFFLSVIVLLSKCGVGCLGFRLMDIGKRCFPLRFWWASWKMVDFQIESGCSASFDFGELSGEKAGVK